MRLSLGMTSRSLLGWLCLSLLAFSACANPINQRTYMNYLDRGNGAFNKGDLANAEEAYRRALINAQVGHLSDEELAIALYRLGRVKRFLCKDEEAENALRDSIEAGRKTAVPDNPYMGQRYLELARLYYDQERYKEVVPPMEKGLSILEKLNVEKTDPAAYAYTLDQYADALRKTNRESEAQAIEARVKALRTRGDLSQMWEKQRWQFQRECKGQKK